MRTATFVRQLDRESNDIDARLYRLSEPMKQYNWTEDRGMRSLYVVVSGSKLPELQQPETYIFLADEAGEIICWSECDGSFQGAIDHEQALRNAGYTILHEQPENS